MEEKILIQSDTNYIQAWRQTSLKILIGGAIGFVAPSFGCATEPYKTMFDAALERHDIQPWYQPVIRTLSGKMCSMEALARWVDPERGIIRPDQFIPVLERHQLIHRLDAAIIREVCAQIRRTVNAGGMPVPVSVNLSRLDFMLCDIFS